MKRIIPWCLASAFFLAPWPAAGPGALSAQSAAADGAHPEGWRMLTDEIGADTTSIRFERMTPGFHVTTGPAAIFYHPDSTATGSFRVEATTHLFDPGSRNEAYGVFIGGNDLMGSYQGYTYFLVRRSGEYLVKRRISATSTETLVDWTPHDAVTGWDDREGDAQSVENRLAVEAGPDELVFYVNDREVDRIPRGREHVEGVVGVRVNHQLDVHFTDFRVAPLDAR